MVTAVRARRRTGRWVETEGRDANLVVVEHSEDEPDDGAGHAPQHERHDVAARLPQHRKTE